MRHRLTLTVLGVCILVLYSSWGRPLWVDEFLHFAFGAFGTPQEAWHAVRESTVGINHGQTGFYMMLDFGLLKLVGANLFALRLPSLLSGILLLYSTAIFLSTKKIGTAGIATAFLLLASQPNLMYFVGEARPYMPLAAASMGVLAYYSLPIGDRSRMHRRILGWGSVVWGSLMMPYFMIYLPTLALASYIAFLVSQQEKPTLRSGIRFVNVPLITTGFVLGIAIGSLTWLRGSPDFDRDPWLYVQQLAAAPSPWVVLAFVMITCLILATLGIAVLQGSGHARRELLAPLVLILAVAAIAGLLALLSLFQDYWILPRQFVASQAIFDVALVWLLTSALAVISQPAKAILAAMLVFSTVVAAGRAAVIQATKLSHWSTLEIPATQIPPGVGNAFEQVAPANQNVAEGGAVWPEFAIIYDEPRILPNEAP